MSEEILLQPSFSKLTEKLDNTQEYEDWLLIQDYIDEIRLEIHNYKQTLNEIREYINKNTDSNPIENLTYKLFIYKKEEYEFIEDILEIIDKALGDEE